MHSQVQRGSITQFLSGGGEMGELMRTKDWSKTPVGEPSRWPQSLRTTLGILLSSKFPMFLWWGPDLIQFYNDSYRPSLGNNGKHPSALGQRGEECWPEIWPVIKPLIDQVMEGGESTWSEDQLIPIYRNGRLEDVYWTFSYSPVKDETDQVNGVLVVCNETTEKVLNVKKIEESEARFRNMVMRAPVGIAIFRGKDFVVEMANESYLQLIDRTHDELIDRPLFTVLPEVKEVVEPLFAGVLNTGLPYYGTELHVTLNRYGKKENAYFNLVYQPLKEQDESIRGIMVVATEVTTLVETKHTLQESEKQFRNLITQSPIAMTIFRGPEWIVEIANDELLKNIWRRELKEVQGKKLLDVFPELKEQQFPQLLKDVFETGIPHREIEALAYVHTPEGEKKYYLDFEYAPLFEANGAVSGIMVTVSNVTDKVEARQLIRDSAERLMLATEGTQLATWDLNLETREIIYSPRLSRIFGHDESKVLTHQDFRNQIHHDDIDSIVEKAFVTARETSVLYYEARVVHPDDSIHWIRTQGKVFFDDQRKPLRMLGTIVDITEQRLYKQRQEENEERLKIVIEASELGTWELNLDPEEFTYSQRYKEIVGYSDSYEPTYEEFLERLHPDDAAIRKQAFDEAYKTGVLHYITRVVWKDGTIHWVEGKGKVFFDHHGKPLKLIGTSRDITEEKIYQQRIEESESRLRIAALSSELGTWTYDPFTKVLSWDNATREMYWIDPETPVTVELFWEKIHPDDRDPALQKMLLALNPDVADTYDAEYRIIGFPDKLKWIHAKGKAFFNEKREPYLFSGTVLDITDKRIALEELQENEQKFRLLADSMPQFVWIADEKGNLNYFNQSVYNYVGLTLEFIRDDGWFLLIHPDEQSENLQRWKYSVQTGEPFLFEHRLRRYNGEFRWQMSRAMPQKDTNGEIQMWVGTSTDIHDRKLFTDELEKEVQQRTKELKKLNDDLVKSNIELGQFAYVASHDLQEPLRKIQTFATRVLDTENESLSDKGKDYFARMQAASKRMQQLIVDLLSYSRANTAEKYFEVTDLNKILQDVRELLKETIEQKRAVIQTDLLPSLNIIPYQFEQLLTNILSNSLKFSKPDDVPRINLTSTMEAGYTIDHPMANHKITYCHMAITDNGIGFDPQFSERIFQVFQRLHSRDEYAGTGIGLAIVKKIVENHKGIITAKSMLGKGVTFDIYIPAV